MDKELIWKEEDGTLGFGDYTLAEKSKVNDFEFDGGECRESGRSAGGLFQDTGTGAGEV